MIKKDLISIITPNYNCEKFIKETIDSVKNQTYTNWELLIIDDYSTDKSIEIIREFQKKDERIKLIQMGKNSGAALCRNKGIEISQGEYICFLDSDDIWDTKKLEKQLNFMKKNNCDFSYTKYSHISEVGEDLKIKIRIPNRITYKKMLFHCYTGCLTVMYNQNLIGKVYGPDITKSNDYGLFLQVLKNTKNAMGIQENLGFYRIRHNSISRNKWKKLKPHFYLLNKIEGKNKLVTLFYIFTNILIKKIYKYERG